MLGTACNNGWDLAVKHINAAGGVNGKQLKLVSYDTKSNPQEALACYERLVSVDGASIVVGPPFSNIGLALADTVDQMKVPFFGQFGDPRCMLGENLDSLHPYMFCRSRRPSIPASIGGAYPHEKFGYTKVAMLIAQEPQLLLPPRPRVHEVRPRRTASPSPHPVLHHHGHDLTVQLTAIGSSGAEYLFNACNTNLLANATQQMLPEGSKLLQSAASTSPTPSTRSWTRRGRRHIYFPVNLTWARIPSRTSPPSTPPPTARSRRQVLDSPMTPCSSPPPPSRRRAERPRRQPRRAGDHLRGSMPDHRQLRDRSRPPTCRWTQDVHLQHRQGPVREHGLVLSPEP